jgi:hypothetical protein
MAFTLTGNMRIDDVFTDMQTAGERYGILDDPDNRWVIDTDRRDLGTVVVYYTDECNIASSFGHCRFGHQDTIRDILDRFSTRKLDLDTSLDLNPL